ncbi:MAG: biosynthetic-type acetolactate synthase large subunit [Thermoclostridium sp.]|nr:biosynthetic-type acetolactate synthase large subunit [Thermoclostridium sp.]
MKMTGAEIVMKLLERQGIKRVAGIPGGANLPLYNALSKSKIRHILVRHEQAAGFIAQGDARRTGRAAVCFATSGPGAMNLLTAIADAKLDSIPIVAITGQVASNLIGTDAFQEVDTFGLSFPITKHSYLVKKPEELFEIIPEAFRIAESDRPGPVLIDIPKDVQMAICRFKAFPKPGKKAEPKSYQDEAALEAARELIQSARSPVIIAGGGIIHSEACTQLRQLAETNNIPVTVTLMGLGAFPADHPLYIGMLGMHAAQYTNLLMNEADLIIAAGIRFDDRATGKVEQFCPNAKIIHMDVDAAEIHKIRMAHIPMTGDAKEILKAVLPHIENNQRKDWISRLQELKEKYPLQICNEDTLHPIRFILKVHSAVPENTAVATDVGQHQMWVAQSWPFTHPRSFLTSGGAGTMGFGLPSALGAALAEPEKRVILFAGDGSILMNIQELDTLAEENLKVTIFVMNNNALGLVRQQQELFYGSNYIASRFESKPDFVKIAEGFGIKAFHLKEASQLEEILEKALNCDGPCLVDVKIDPSLNVLPMVPPGGANIEMIC